MGTHVDPTKWNLIGRLHSRPLEVLALKFLHALEIDKGLLAHTRKRARGPPKNFKGEH